MAEERFYEEQWPPEVVGGVLAGLAAGGILGALGTRSLELPWVRGLLTAAGGMGAALGAFAPMRTRVTDEGVTLTFGLPGWIRFRIGGDGIQEVEAVTYRPLMEFGGWGIRFGSGGVHAYTMRGDRGVRIRKPGRTYLIGSQRPEELAAALQRPKQ